MSGGVLRFKWVEKYLAQGKCSINTVCYPFIHCCLINFPKIQWLKTTTYCFLFHSPVGSPVWFSPGVAYAVTVMPGDDGATAVLSHSQPWCLHLGGLQPRELSEHFSLFVATLCFLTARQSHESWNKISYRAASFPQSKHSKRQEVEIASQSIPIVHTGTTKTLMPYSIRSE